MSQELREASPRNPGVQRGTIKDIWGVYWFRDEVCQINLMKRRWEEFPIKAAADDWLEGQYALESLSWPWELDNRRK